jgi:hypothetical protein
MAADHVGVEIGVTLPPPRASFRADVSDDTGNAANVHEISGSRGTVMSVSTAAMAWKQQLCVPPKERERGGVRQGSGARTSEKMFRFRAWWPCCESGVKFAPRTAPYALKYGSFDAADALARKSIFFANLPLHEHENFITDDLLDLLKRARSNCLSADASGDDGNNSDDDRGSNDAASAPSASFGGSQLRCDSDGKPFPTSVVMLLPPREHPPEYLSAFAEAFAMAGYFVVSPLFECDFDDGYPGTQWIRFRQIRLTAAYLAFRASCAREVPVDASDDRSGRAMSHSFEHLEPDDGGAPPELWSTLDLSSGVVVVGHGLGSINSANMCGGGWLSPDFPLPRGADPTTNVSELDRREAQWLLPTADTLGEMMPPLRSVVLLDYWREITNDNVEFLSSKPHCPLFLIQSAHWHASPSLMVLDGLIKPSVAKPRATEKPPPGRGGMLIAKFSDASNHDFTDLPFYVDPLSFPRILLREVTHLDDSPILLGPGDARMRCNAAIELAVSFAERSNDQLGSAAWLDERWPLVIAAKYDACQLETEAVEWGS